MGVFVKEFLFGGKDLARIRGSVTWHCTCDEGSIVCDDVCWIYPKKKVNF